ncbi:MAG: hypothetical protein L7H07_02195, partial [Candidatus Nanopusillus sp.]|nr:hypothetical protein [Candidatus Nanopusillus sp.]
SNEGQQLGSSLEQGLSNFEKDLSGLGASLESGFSNVLKWLSNEGQQLGSSLEQGLSNLLKFISKWGFLNGIQLGNQNQISTSSPSSPSSPSHPIIHTSSPSSPSPYPYLIPYPIYSTGLSNPFIQGEQSHPSSPSSPNSLQGSISSSQNAANPPEIIIESIPSQQGFSTSEYFLMFVFVIILLVMGILLLR